MAILQLCPRKVSHKETLLQTLFDQSCILVQKLNKSIFEKPVRELSGNVRTRTRWKARANFLVVTVELLRYFLQLRRYRRNSVEMGVFRSGIGHFESKFQTELT